MLLICLYLGDTENGGSEHRDPWGPLSDWGASGKAFEMIL